MGCFVGKYMIISLEVSFSFYLVKENGCLVYIFGENCRNVYIVFFLIVKIVLIIGFFYFILRVFSVC